MALSYNITTTGGSYERTSSGHDRGEGKTAESEGAHAQSQPRAGLGARSGARRLYSQPQARAGGLRDGLPLLHPRSGEGCERLHGQTHPQ